MAPVPDAELGLAPGGLMRQEVYEDPHGFDAWDTSVRFRCFVHILNSVQYLGVTGREPPTNPWVRRSTRRPGCRGLTTTVLTWTPWPAPGSSRAWIAWRRRASSWALGSPPATSR